MFLTRSNICQYSIIVIANPTSHHWNVPIYNQIGTVDSIQLYQACCEIYLRISKHKHIELIVGFE